MTDKKVIPFNRPHLTGSELRYINKAHKKGILAGNGFFTQKCQSWIEHRIGVKKALLTHSCTAALEMAAILADIQPGDEIIMPSYTFVSTANAFVLRGGVPIFVDIRPDTLNIDEKLIEKAITRKTKAIVPVHYAGVGCEMDTILKIARRNKLLVIEDAAHGVKATYKGRELGTMGDFGALSFHETKNIISGEGGALLVNNAKFIKRAEIVWQKGTDRNRFLRGEVDKYTWRDIGSSFLPGELVAAFLWAQLAEADDITKKRLEIWNRYHQALGSLEIAGKFLRPQIPKNCRHNAHMYYAIFSSQIVRNKFIKHLQRYNIKSVFHYLPLHLSKFAKNNYARKKNKKNSSDCSVSKYISERIVRLPFYTKMKKEEQQMVINGIKSFKNKIW
jgi:dTDP-4-amino-4,6-dideoxygalactose transaminase